MESGAVVPVLDLSEGPRQILRQGLASRTPRSRIKAVHTDDVNITCMCIICTSVCVHVCMSSCGCECTNMYVCARRMNAGVKPIDSPNSTPIYLPLAPSHPKAVRPQALFP